MNKYIERFISTRSCEDVVGLFSCCNNTKKEITESWAMLEAAKKYTEDLSKMFVLVIGDGVLPRTGALFAYYTKATVLSIDPIMNIRKFMAWKNAKNLEPKNLFVKDAKVEDTPVALNGSDVLVIWPHSHAPMGKERISNHGRRIDIAMPCCVNIPSGFMRREHLVYEDVHVLSPKNKVHVWK